MLDFMKWEVMESGKKMKKELHTIEFESLDELMDFLEFLLNDEPEICLTKSQLYKACDDAWEVWATNDNPSREDKILVAHFVRVLTGKLFGDDKTEKEEN